jgi:hypothetical protein
MKLTAYVDSTISGGAGEHRRVSRLRALGGRCDGVGTIVVAEEFAQVGFLRADAVEEVEKEGDAEGQGVPAWTPSHRRVLVMQTFSSDRLILTSAEPLAGGNVTSIGRRLGGRGGIGG